jgi:hypothetical protein
LLKNYFSASQGKLLDLKTVSKCLFEIDKSKEAIANLVCAGMNITIIILNFLSADIISIKYLEVEGGESDNL